MSQENETNKGAGQPELETKESLPPAGEPGAANQVRKRTRKAKQKRPVPMVRHVCVRVPGRVYAFLRDQCRKLGTQPEDLASFVLENGKLLKSEEVRFGTVAPNGSTPVVADEIAEEGFRSINVPISRQLHRNLRDWSSRCGWTEEGVAGEILLRLAGNYEISSGIREALLRSHEQARGDFNHRVVIPDHQPELAQAGT